MSEKPDSIPAPDASAGVVRRRRIMRRLEKTLASAVESIDRELGNGYAREHPVLVGAVLLAHEIAALHGSAQSNANSIIRALAEIASQVDGAGRAIVDLDETLFK